MSRDHLLIEISSSTLQTLIQTQGLQITNTENVKWLTESALRIAENMVKVFEDNGIYCDSYRMKGNLE